jgi:hypothetical protein
MFPNSKETNPITAEKADPIMLNTTYNEKKLICVYVYAHARLFVCVFLAVVTHQGTQDEYLKGRRLNVVL